MSAALKNSPRTRRHKQRPLENMKQEIVAQVHKQVKSTTSSDNDYANSEDNLDVPKSDKNENYSGKLNDKLSHTKVYNTNTKDNNINS